MAPVTQNPRSTAPLYRIADAALYGRVHPLTLRHWVEGYTGRDGRRYDALLRLPDDQIDGERLLSFENLIEAALIGSWRRRGTPLQWIRRAQELAIGDYGPHPFATQQVYVSGTDLFMRAEDETDAGGASFTVITKGHQRVLAPAIRDYLSRIDWRTGETTPFQWRPTEGDDVVRLNPDISFGLPAVRRIRTETIRDRFLAREPVALIAEDFGLELEEVETALRYEWSLRRTA